MVKNNARAPAFAGSQTVQTVANLDAFVNKATAGERFIYLEAPAPIRGDTWQRVREHAAAGLVDPLQERRAGGGYCFIVERTRRSITRQVNPVEAALADPATAAILTALRRAANFGLPCPSDADLARSSGLASRYQAQWRVRKLIELKLIESVQFYDGGVPSRVVTILATGKSTALPTKWARAQASMARDAGLGGEGVR